MRSSSMPVSWEDTTLGSMTTEENVRVGRMNSVIVLSSTKHRGLVPSDDYFKNRAIYSADLSNYKRVQDGWFAYATNHLTEGSIGLYRGAAAACVSPIYTVFSCKPQVYPEYLFRLLKSPMLMSQYRMHEQASVDRRGAVRYRDFGRVQTLLPPLSEQRGIVAILESLDKAIRETEAISSKLRGVRQGLRYDLLTRGLDESGELRPPSSDAPDEYRDSPLGPVPSRWQVARLGTYLDGTPQNGVYKPLELYGSSGTPIIRIDGFHDGVLAPLESFKRLRLTPVDVRLYRLEEGDLLVNRVNSVD